jgi:hypothetical protein
MIAPIGLAGKPLDVGCWLGGRTMGPDGLPIGTFHELEFLPRDFPRDFMPPNAVFSLFRSIFVPRSSPGEIPKTQ